VSTRYRNQNLFNTKYGKHGEKEILTGEICSITFHNETNGFTVATLLLDSSDVKVSIVGNLGSPEMGMWIKVEGDWDLKNKFGPQLRIQKWDKANPTTKSGIIKFLSSGMIYGVGKSIALKIFSEFGLNSLQIIDKYPERLVEIDGIGKKKSEKIIESFQKHKNISDSMVFLQGYGVGPSTSIKIFKKYGQNTIEMIKENPYRLANEIWGIGFKIADRMALSMGIPPESPKRIKAALLYALKNGQKEGHVYLPEEILLERTSNFLNLDIKYFSFVFDEVIAENQAVKEGEKIYHPIMYKKENQLCSDLILLFKSKKYKKISSEKIKNYFKKQVEIVFEDEQKEAIIESLNNKVTIITGGPGTGKTTLIQAITNICKKHELKLLLGAPTGRASKRLSESSGEEAKTLHRMMEYQPKTNKFQKNKIDQLNGDVVIIDEVSMVDLNLMHALLQSIPKESRLILVGDVDQLPSVGPGTILKSLIESKILPVIKLKKIFRQAKESVIVKCAHEINRGDQIHDGKGGKGDLFFIKRDSPTDVMDLIEELVVNRIPSSYGFNPVKDIQVLTPMHKGIMGTENINLRLQKRFNSKSISFEFGGKEWIVGDKVIQLKNNYDLDIFNGDLGVIKNYNKNDEEITISFDNRNIVRSVSDLAEMTLAYATTIHKSQGSEYPAVVIPVHTQHAIMLQRNLIYTAVTRAKRLVVLVGTKRALSLAVSNSTQKRRYSYLSERLIEYYRVLNSY
jgi:exodeoxyribonuclease V alpha subunit